jgi:hypothetical protein
MFDGHFSFAMTQPNQANHPTHIHETPITPTTPQINKQQSTNRTTLLTPSEGLLPSVITSDSRFPIMQTMKVFRAARAMQGSMAGRRALCGLPQQRTMLGVTTPEQERKKQHPLSLSSAHHGIRALHGTPQNENAGLIAIGVGVAALGVRQVAVVSIIAVLHLYFLPLSDPFFASEECKPVYYTIY